MPTPTALERAIGAWLQTLTFDGKTIASFPARFAGDEQTEVPLQVHCICGALDEEGNLPESWEKLQLPALVVSTLRADLATFGPAEVTLTLLSSPDEVDAPERIEERFRWLLQLFHDDNLDDVAAAITAASADVHVIGMTLADADPTENGLQVRRALRLQVVATTKG